MHRRFLPALMSCLLAGASWALPPAQDLTGGLSAAEITGSLLPLDRWFLRADNRCPADSKDCQIRLSLNVPAGGGHPDCSVVSTTIADPAISGLYCQVARVASFPVKAQASSFTLQFPAPPGVPAAPRDPQFRLADSASACPDLDHLRNQDDVHGCFDQYKSYFDAVYHEALQKNPDMQGSFIIRLSLDKDGRVTDASADYAEGNLSTDFINAELAVVRKMRFGWGQQAMDATYSVHFLGP